MARPVASRAWLNGATMALGTLVILSTLAVALAGCGGSPSGTTSKGVVKVAYAGSLVNLMEHTFGPDFTKATGYGFQGTGAGSTALASQIKSKLISPDVFISASAKAYDTLTGAANGNLVSWHINFGATSIVIGYSPQSRFASQLQAAASGATPWYQVLETPGLRIGRTDPKLDPKGIYTLYTMQLAEIYYKQPGLSQKILGDPENASQIFPEETLVARLTSGQLDAGFFYLNEAIDAHIPYITLPNQINLSQPSLKSYYAQASYTSATGKQTGGPIIYSITILSTAKNEAGAVAFVQYILGSAGQSVLHADGILPTAFTFTGDASKVPTGLKQYTS
ncbi:MAG TPA: extracellular solute-binding protein [Ktedonobacterales bacterium]|nr:extracellular solute-binding protein [Ktedonobacterales bacterium]